MLGIEPATLFLEDVASSVPGVRVVDAGPLGGAHPEGLLHRLVLDVPRSTDTYESLLRALVRMNRWYRQNGWGSFTIYDGRIRYRAEPPGQEVWQSIPALFARGEGDCVDLATARVAQLPKTVRATARLQEEGPNQTGGTLYHVVVATKNGIEDPSRKLGMR